jgi:hypothetical protein
MEAGRLFGYVVINKKMVINFDLKDSINGNIYHDLGMSLVAKRF